jgi:serine protease Do
MPAMTMSQGVNRLKVALMGGAAILGTSLAGGTVLTAEARQPIQIEAPGGAPMSFADLIEQVSPSVVSINVVSEREVPRIGIPELLNPFRDLPESDDEDDEDDDSDRPTRRVGGLGSGFFVSDDGFIVTNNHVVDEATEITVVMDDGTELEAELIGADGETDLAVLKVDPVNGQRFRYVEFSDNVDLRVGDWVVAVGNPFGLGGTATAGIVSAKGQRNDRGRSSSYVDYIQTDASINRGNSGGPTFDLNGNVIGVNTAILSPSGGSVGIGFAIPADVASDIVDMLIEDGEVTRGWLGVTIQSLSEDMAEALGLPNNNGAIISNVTADSPADKFGLQQGDIVLGLNGRSVEDSVDLTRQVGALIAGTRNDFRLLRRGSERLVNVRVDERPKDLTEQVNRPTADDPDPRDYEDSDVEVPLGAMMAALDADEAEDIGVEGGVVITDLMARGPLGEMRLEPGLVITEVNLKPVSTPEEYADAVTDARRTGREHVALAIVSEGRTIYLAVPFDGQS